MARSSARETFEQDPLFDQPISIGDVHTYLEALHTAREREEEIAAEMKECKDDIKDALKNLRKIRQRLNLAAQRESGQSIARGIVDRLDGVTWDAGNGVTASVTANRATG